MGFRVSKNGTSWVAIFLGGSTVFHLCCWIRPVGMAAFRLCGISLVFGVEGGGLRTWVVKFKVFGVWGSNAGFGACGLGRETVLR